MYTLSQQDRTFKLLHRGSMCSTCSLYSKVSQGPTQKILRTLRSRQLPIGEQNKCYTFIMANFVSSLCAFTKFGYMHKYVHTYICTYILMYVHMYVHVYACIYVHMYVHKYIHMYVYIHMYIRTYICTHIHTYARTSVRLPIHPYRHTYIHWRQN